MKVAKEKIVAIDYKLTDPAGTVLDSSEEGGPLSYLHGVGGLLPALEVELDGKTEGDSFAVVLAPEDGYGVRDESLRQEVARKEFADVPDLDVGMQFRVSGDDNLPVFTVVEVGEESVTIDGNHPLADVTLHFDVTVRDVRDATEEEIAHGHSHGPGGHDHGD
jgi:FKBP-type peptidyl-prolyl cis-trans isomerase SlyD